MQAIDSVANHEVILNCVQLGTLFGTDDSNTGLLFVHWTTLVNFMRRLSEMAAIEKEPFLLEGEKVNMGTMFYSFLSSVRTRSVYMASDSFSTLREYAPSEPLIVKTGILLGDLLKFEQLDDEIIEELVYVIKPGLQSGTRRLRPHVDKSQDFAL